MTPFHSSYTLTFPQTEENPKQSPYYTFSVKSSLMCLLLCFRKHTLTRRNREVSVQATEVNSVRGFIKTSDKPVESPFMKEKK